jgi:hypothetical protein
VSDSFGVRVFYLHRDLLGVPFEVIQVFAPDDKATIDVESVTAPFLDYTV